ncbi:hypothetical protein B0H19DRAFT_1056515 [Mycena capillaripes]|nr:hypothetical protein B0H19DRAFT_1056515 [Mycena capillaripes]
MQSCGAKPAAVPSTLSFAQFESQKMKRTQGLELARSGSGGRFAEREVVHRQTEPRLSCSGNHLNYGILGGEESGDFLDRGPALFYRQDQAKGGQIYTTYFGSCMREGNMFGIPAPPHIQYNGAPLVEMPDDAKALGEPIALWCYGSRSSPTWMTTLILPNFILGEFPSELFFPATNPSSGADHKGGA